VVSWRSVNVNFICRCWFVYQFLFGHKVGSGWCWFSFFCASFYQTASLNFGRFKTALTKCPQTHVLPKGYTNYPPYCGGKPPRAPQNRKGGLFYSGGLTSPKPPYTGGQCPPKPPDYHRSARSLVGGQYPPTPPKFNRIGTTLTQLGSGFDVVKYYFTTSP
jgi:hypothetical protein